MLGVPASLTARLCALSRRREWRLAACLSVWRAMIFKFGVTFSAQALTRLPVVTCSLAQCFAELPCTHTHAAAIALPPPASRTVARAAAEGCSSATRQQERTAVSSAAEARPDPATSAPRRPSLVALLPEVLRGVLQVGTRVTRVTMRGEFSPAYRECCPGSQGAALFGCGGKTYMRSHNPHAVKALADVRALAETC